MFRKMRRTRQELPASAAEEMLRRGRYGVLAVCGDDEYPYAVPLNYYYEDGAIYFHCARSGHKLDAIRRSDKVSFCVTDLEELRPERFTTVFRSVIAFGRAALVEDEEEKRRLICAFAGHFCPMEPEEALQAEVRSEWNALAMVKITIEHVTAKEAIELVREREKAEK